MLRRFATQQKHIAWSASPYAAVPLRAPSVHSSIDEDWVLGRAAAAFMDGEARTKSGRMTYRGENVWF